MDIRRTIEDVLDLENGKEISAKEFFRRPFDQLIQDREVQELANKGKRERWLVCATCGENIRILGGKREDEWKKRGKNFHFAHLHNSKDCPIKTDSKYSREDINRMRYRGIAEGKPHIELKEKLYQGLNLNAIHKGQVTELQLERVIRSLDEFEWRKPDINLLFNGRRLAIELQLSTTWLDVIVGRQAFYRQEGIFILWIFNEFDYKDSTRKLAYSDIIYTNNYNAYIFDEEARAVTMREKDLVLKCYYQHHYAKDDRILGRWEHQLVKLEDLTFDQQSMKVYYRDIAAEKLQAAKSVAEFKAKKQKEIDDRRSERNRLRSLRAGYQSEYKVKRTELTNTGQEIEKLERNLREQQRKLNSAQTDLFNLLITAQEISSRLDGYWASLPTQTGELKDKLKEQQKQLITAIKEAEELHQRLSQKDDYYRKGRVKRLNGNEYHVLDRVRHWEYITMNPDKVMAYRNDQANNLFSSPELQALNSHKIMQMRHNLKIDFVIDLSEEFAENTAALRAAHAQLIQYRKDKEELESTLPGLFEEVLRKEYTAAIEVLEDQVAAIRVQLEQKTIEKQNIEKEADDISYEIMELDYLDDYDEEDRYH